MAVKTAFVTVSNTTGLGEFGVGLHRLGYQFLATDTAARVLQEAGEEAGEKMRIIKVSDFTGVPPILGGRVKTIHHLIFALLLADYSNPEHLETLAALGQKTGVGVARIDLVISNPYDTPAIIESKAQLCADYFPILHDAVDIGGPAGFRAGVGKNGDQISGVVDPADYDWVLGSLTVRGYLNEQERIFLAWRAFALSARNDEAAAQLALDRMSLDFLARTRLG